MTTRTLFHSKIRRFYTFSEHLMIRIGDIRAFNTFPLNINKKNILGYHTLLKLFE